MSSTIGTSLNRTTSATFTSGEVALNQSYVAWTTKIEAEYAVNITALEALAGVFSTADQKPFHDMTLLILEDVTLVGTESIETILNTTLTGKILFKTKADFGAGIDQSISRIFNAPFILNKAGVYTIVNSFSADGAIIGSAFADLTVMGYITSGSEPFPFKFR